MNTIHFLDFLLWSILTTDAYEKRDGMKVLSKILLCSNFKDEATR